MKTIYDITIEPQFEETKLENKTLTVVLSFNGVKHTFHPKLEIKDKDYINLMLQIDPDNTFLTRTRFLKLNKGNIEKIEDKYFWIKELGAKPVELRHKLISDKVHFCMPAETITDNSGDDQ
ncbi:MAG: hypothetical protein ACOCQD_05460 [archaeon]